VSATDVVSSRTLLHDSDSTQTEAVYTTWTSDGRYLTLIGSQYPFVSGGESDIKAQFFDEDGVPDGGATQIDGAETSPGKATLWGLAAADTGGYYYAHTEAAGGEIFLGYHADDHSDIETRATVVSGADKFGELERCVVRSGNVIAVAYQRYSASGKEARLVVTFYDLALSPLASNVEVSDVTPTSDASFDKFLGIRAADNGRFVVGWIDQPEGEDDFTDSTVRVRFFTSAGAVDGASDTLYAPGLLEPPFGDPPIRSPNRFDISASGNYIVVAENLLTLNVSDYERALALTVYEYNGSTWSQVQQIATDSAAVNYGATFADFETSIERLADGSFVTLYHHVSDDSPYTVDLRAQRFALTECV
jgi:hypothetical protein